MKKYFIIAAAAVVAMAACSRNEVEFNPTAPSNKIGFEVANYTPQTKSETINPITNSEDGIYSFHTLANHFPEIGNPVRFMDVDILPWSNETEPVQVTAANDADKYIGAWRPAEDYYWPKTGYINFYSYAGTPSPTQIEVNDGNGQDWKTVTLTYENAEIKATSNILVADAALHYGRDNYDTATYQKDDSEASGHITKGVPTLFHHQLAKVIFDVRARTTTAKVSQNTTWKVQVLGTHTYTPTGGSETTIKSTIKPINKGTLVLTNEDDRTSAGTKAWSNAANDTNISGWAPSTVASDKEEIVFTETAAIATAPEALVIPATKIESVNDSNAPYDPIVILAARSVMPQLTQNVAFTLVYRVQALHGNTVFMDEIRTVGISTTAVLKDLVNSISSWKANQKITYHIIIDPVSEKVTFDPAVEDYDPIDADGVNDYINIDEDGIVVPQP